MAGGSGRQQQLAVDNKEPGEGGASFWGSGGYGDDTSPDSFGAGGCGGDYHWASGPPGDGCGGVVVIEYF
jgi:hypothetical protein